MWRTSSAGVSFHVHRGEILGITGLVGAGRTEMARLVFGADERDSGVVELDGRQLEIRSPREAIRQGICLLVEDRKADGLVLGRSAKENFALPNLGSLSSWGFLLLHRENALWNRLVDGLRINAYPGQLATHLRGDHRRRARYTRTDHATGGRLKQA